MYAQDIRSKEVAMMCCWSWVYKTEWATGEAPP